MAEKTNEKGVVKVWLENDGIVYTYFAGKIRTEEVKKFVDEKKKILEKIEGKVKSFADIRDITVGIDFSMTEEAKKLLIPELRELMQQRVKKMAILGNNISLKFITIAFGIALGIKNIKYFTNKQEALKWLKED